MTSIGTFALGTGGILDITIPAPPQAVDWDFIVPDRSRLRLICGRCALLTSAAVATRRAQLWIAVAANTIAQSSNQFPQPASTSYAYTLTPGADIQIFVAGFEQFLVFPPGLILTGADQLGVVTANIQANDQWGPTYLRFEQWIEP